MFLSFLKQTGSALFPLFCLTVSSLIWPLLSCVLFPFFPRLNSLHSFYFCPLRLRTQYYGLSTGLQQTYCIRHISKTHHQASPISGTAPPPCWWSTHSPMHHSLCRLQNGDESRQSGGMQGGVIPGQWVGRE